MLLAVLAVVGSSGEHGEQLLMAVDGCSTPVGLVGKGSDVLVVVLGELQVDSGGVCGLGTAWRREGTAPHWGRRPRASRREAQRGDGP